jgi:hypothetical protein
MMTELLLTDMQILGVASQALDSTRGMPVSPFHGQMHALDGCCRRYRGEKEAKIRHRVYRRRASLELPSRNKQARLFYSVNCLVP